MSWTIEIATGEFSADDVEAWEELESLRDEEDQREYGEPPSADMKVLYDRLTAKYPCIMEDPNSPWSDGPLINNFGDKLATLGFVSSGMADAHPFVIETATELGFTVFDAGDEKIHRPAGWQPPPTKFGSSATETDVPFRRPWWRFW